MQHPASGRSWVAFGFAVALTLAVVIMARADAVAGRPVFGLATIALAAAFAVLATTIGLAGLLAGRREEPAEGAGVRGSWSHVVRLGVVLLLVVGAAIVVRAVLVPESYGRYGYYRGDAAREAMFAAVPRHVGRTMCAGCHTREGSLIAKDVHGGIECESCHGPGGDHVASIRPDDPANREHVALFIPQTQEPCLWCHRRLAARPSPFPQIDPAEHFRFLGVSDPQTPCMRCHNPHEPLFLDRPLREARLHPVIQQCRDCHADAVAADVPRPDDHPVVFECRYCHPEVAADFASRPHASLGCSRCHLYHRESDTAGRIVKNRDPRFCLLCHRRNPFRGPGAPPLIDWPAHREQLAPGNESVDCVDCHLDRIHRHTVDLRPAAARGAP
jgi:predicted CXXCH cytochrome family protein